MRQSQVPDIYSAINDLAKPATTLAAYSAAAYLIAFLLGWVYLYGYFSQMEAIWALGAVPITSVALEALLPRYAVLAMAAALAYLHHRGWLSSRWNLRLSLWSLGVFVGGIAMLAWVALERPLLLAGLPMLVKAWLALYVATSILRSAIHLKSGETRLTDEVGFWLGIMMPCILPLMLCALGKVQGKVDSSLLASSLPRVLDADRQVMCDWVLIKQLDSERGLVAKLGKAGPPVLKIISSSEVRVSSFQSCAKEIPGITPAM